MKNKNSISLSTMIYFTALIVLLIASVITGDFSISYLVLIVFTTTVPYIFFTKKLYLLTPIVSIFLLMYVISLLPSAVYSVTGEEPTFIVAFPLFGFFITLYYANLLSHSEWAIKSPWIANILGLIVSYIFSFGILTLFEDLSQLIIGLLSLLVYLVISLSWLTFGRFTIVHKPNEYSDSAIAKEIINELIFSEFEKIDSKKQKSTVRFLDTQSENKNSYRLFFTDSKVKIPNEVVKLNEYVVLKKNKEKHLYSWLFQQSNKSNEAKTTKKIKHEDFILIIVDSKTKSPESYIAEIPKPRSKKTLNIGVLKIGNEYKKAYRNQLIKLFIDLDLKRNS